MTDNLKYPFTFDDVNEEEKEMVIRCFDREIVRVSGTKLAVQKTIQKYGSEIYNLKPRPDDIWLIGFPRSGTTMLQEILYLLGTDLNYEEAASTIMDYRFPYLENALMREFGNPELHKELLSRNRTPQTQEDLDTIAPHVRLANVEGKRFIKSHLNFKFLHPDVLTVGCKVVFIARNIKDCFVSNYFFPLKKRCQRSDEKQLSELFYCYKNNLCMWGNYFEVLKEAWENRHNKNLLFLIYEEVIADRKAAIKKISTFLGKDLTADQLEKLADHVSLDNFKKNKSVNNEHLVKSGFFVKSDKFCFIRKGGSGGWREEFSEELNNEFNEWININMKDIPGFEMPECWKKAMDL